MTLKYMYDNYFAFHVSTFISFSYMCWSTYTFWISKKDTLQDASLRLIQNYFMGVINYAIAVATCNAHEIKTCLGSINTYLRHAIITMNYYRFPFQDYRFNLYYPSFFSSQLHIKKWF